MRVVTMGVASEINTEQGKVMEVEPKDFLTWSTFLVGVGAMWGKVRGYIKKTDRHEKLLYPEDGEPHFITYPAHDKMQENCQKFILSELQHMSKNIEEVKGYLEKERERRV